THPDTLVLARAGRPGSVTMPSHRPTYHARPPPGEAAPGRADGPPGLTTSRESPQQVRRLQAGPNSSTFRAGTATGDAACCADYKNA
ncbi:MAG TPA: hypothetical protein VF457_17360, partial [Burkholderiaceae bacterium]